MDTSKVEKFFAVWPEDSQQKGQTLVVRTVCDAVSVVFRQENESWKSALKKIYTTDGCETLKHVLLRTWMGWIWTCWLRTYLWTTTSSSPSSAVCQRRPTNLCRRRLNPQLWNLQPQRAGNGEKGSFENAAWLNKWRLQKSWKSKTILNTHNKPHFDA